MSSLIEPNIHPILVHFAYALSITGAFCMLVGAFAPDRPWRNSLKITGDWMLAFGAIAIVATIAAGFQAYYTVAHDGPSHAAMTVHRNWAVPSGLAIMALAAWRWTKRSERPSGLFAILLAAAAIAMTVTAWWGAKIVYGYGLGVKSLPTVTGDGHDHEHGPGAAGSDAAPGAGHDDGGAGAHAHPDSSSDSSPDSGEEPSAMPEVPAGHDNSDGHHDDDPT